MAAVSVPHARSGNTESWLTTARFSVILLVALVLAYPDAVFFGKSFFFRDYAFYGYPLAFYHKECFWNGELPLWTSQHNLGQPFLAQWNTMVLYPGSLIYLLLPLPWSLNIFGLAHLFLGGLGMFLFVRHLWSHPFAAAFAGLAYTFNGFALTSLMWPCNVAAWGWLPWVLWSGQLAWRHGGQALPLAVLAWAMQFLTGGVEIVIQTWLLAGGLFALDWWSSGDRLKATIRAAALPVLALALSAVQLLPFLDLLAHSQRDSAWSSSSWSMPAWGWLNLFVPLFGSYPGSQEVYTQVGHAWVNTYYPGFLVTLLAILALWVNPSRLVVFCWLFVLVSLALAQGGEGLVYGPVRALVPQLGYIRFPVKFIVLAVALLPVLAAAGLRQALATVAPEAQKQMCRKLVVLGCVMALVTAFAAWFDSYLRLPEVSWQTTLWSGLGRLPAYALAAFLILRLMGTNFAAAGWRFGAVLLVLVWGDPLLLGKRPNPTVASWVYKPELIRAELGLPSTIGPAGPRLHPSPESEMRLRGHSLDTPEDQVAYGRMAAFDNLNLLDRLPKLHGFYPLELDHFVELLPWYYTQPDERVRSLIEFAGLAYTQKSGTAAEWIKKWTPAPLITAGQNPVALPERGVLHLLHQERFRPDREVYFYPSEIYDLKDVVPGQATIGEMDWQHQEIRFEVTAKAPSIVVLSMAYYHPWTAEIDGQRLPLRKANHSFTALKVPPGTHQVKLTYVDQKFRTGLVISSLTLLLVLGMMWFAKKKLKVA
ncbi:MAG: YfhO family protein [Verrucomicrobiota bacterium]